MSLDDAVTVLEGVGPKTAEQFADGLAIHTVGDLLHHYPRRHDDLGELMDLSAVTVGEPATLVGTVLDWTTRTVPRRGRRGRLTISEAVVATDPGPTFLVTFFNQGWRPNTLPRGSIAAFSGKVERFRSMLKISTPEVVDLGRARDVDAGEAVAALDHQVLLPVYPATEDLPTWKLARWVEQALESVPPYADWLDEDTLDRFDLVTLDQAMRWIHVPPDKPSFSAARRRLVFDELYALQLGLQWRRAHLRARLAGVDNHPRPDGQAVAFWDSLPFTPTEAQTDAVAEIGTDLGAEAPMHRLLQGDVGSGKTLVAVHAMLTAVDNGRQAALMVPTEVLADQHFLTLLELLEPLGVNMFDGVRVELLTSSTTTTERRRILSGLLTGEVDLLVGTHALLTEEVRFADLGLVVVDEQHRFGVNQRVGLKDKRDAPSADGRATIPDVLVMTATPIPRSLALTLYGDLDVTVLDELPSGRKPIVTQLITPDQVGRRQKLMAFVREQASEGLQTYVVCPLVEESDALEGVKSAVAEHRRLSRDVFPDLEVALVHGQLSAADKEAAMTSFRTGAASVLVATTVIEVGVDVPTATIMVVENADRFGISQLHQLRGRVGRGADMSYCVLFADPVNDDTRERLEAVAATVDGFELADVDLRIRGQGQLFGARQSGMPDLKLASLHRDLSVVAATRNLARSVIDADPDFTDHPLLRAEVLRRYEGGLEDFAALQTG
nr:ATP-dependent DNA helicase RecG [Salsipaludibacter albus]